MSEVGLVIVGSAGVIGRTHVRGILGTETARLVGVHDVNSEGARAQAEEHGVRFFQTLEDVLLDPDVDAITIGTPHPLHPPIAMAAFQAGKHVLTEKPIASTLTQADEMAAAARRAGATLGVVFQHRFRPEVSRMKDLIEAGALGRIYRTTLVQAAFRSQAYYETAAWRGTWKLEGGGVLLNQSVHFIDLLQWLGGMPKSVQGMAGTLAHDIEVEDSASALLEYEDGGHGLVHCDTVQFPSQERLELWGDRGGLILQNDQLTYHRLDESISDFSKRVSDPRARPVSRRDPTGVVHPRTSHQDAIEDFVAALQEGREPAVPGEEGVKSLELIAAIITSACRGQAVTLPVDRRSYDDLLDELSARRSLIRP